MADMHPINCVGPSMIPADSSLSRCYDWEPERRLCVAVAPLSISRHDHL